MNTIETLEPRRMLAATLTSNGTLNIRATSGNDVIRLGFDDTFVNTVAVTINGEQRLFQGRDVKRINLDALTGHDRIYVDRSLSGLGGIKLNIDPGRGDDQIRIEDVGQVKVMLHSITASDRIRLDTAMKDYSSIRIFADSSHVGSGVTMTNEGDVQFTNSNSRLHGDGSFLNYGNQSSTGRLETTEPPINNTSGYLTLSARPAFTVIDDSLLLAGNNAGTSNLTQRPTLTANQLKKIKPGIVTIDQSWEVTRVETEGKIVWLKVRGDASRRNLELDTPIQRISSFTVDPSKYPAGAKERKIKVSFMAVHRDSVLAIGGLRGEIAVPTAPSYANANGVVFASGAKVRLMNDWGKSHTVKDKIPLEPGVNPHGRRGIIVDDGIIWFDDVERPYFQKISL